MASLSFPRLCAFLASLALLAFPAGATWSIVAVNSRTGEVAVASATCLASFNLRHAVPVIVVGKGAAAAQSVIDVGAVNRTKIYEALLTTSLTPQEILDLLSSEASFQSRQYGIAAFTGAPVTFTGRRAGNAATGVTGGIDDYLYAIQGNLLTDDAVVFAAEAAFRSTGGDMGERLMAAMEAARALGGDGRCSCSISAPTSCGAPPPVFSKSAHCGFVIVARIGDVDAPCDPNKGCALGTYYMTLNVAGSSAQPSDPDPVFQLQDKYANWRADHVGRADGILSTVDAVQSMPADGATRRTVTVKLVDLDGVALTSGGASVEVATVDGGPSLSSVGAVSDHGDGSYSFELAAGTQVGLDRFVISADDGVIRATLYPYLEVRLDPALPLHVGYDEVSASRAPEVPFVVNAPGRAGEKYVLLASLSGTQPGHHLGDVFLPLNPVVVSVALGNVDGARLPGTLGLLSDRGRAEGRLASSPGLLASLIGRRIDWTAVIFGADGARATDPVGFDVVP